MLLRLAGAVGAAALLAGAAQASERPFPRLAGCVRADFASAGTTVRAARCGPASGPRAVIVLHGCGGFSTFDHRLATDLPRRGIATLYVDYFGPTPPPGNRGFCDVRPRQANVFGIWERVAADAALSLRPYYAKVGAVGWSLGAGVALAAAEDLHVFDAVAAFSAFASPPIVSRERLLPPSIFLDGGPRDIVPPANARALHAGARLAHVPTALYVYGNGTHNWPGRQGELGRARAAAFLLRYLR
jgi:dienelactone hydrolase